MSDTGKMVIRASRKKPQRTVDGNWIGQRGDQLGNQIARILSSREDALAEEGSYFTCTNPTPGTGIPTIAALTTFADVSPFILIQNQTQPEEKERFTLKWLRLLCAAAGTGGSSIRYAIKTDSINPTRYSSGGSTYPGSATPLNINNVNQDDSTPPNVFVAAGAIVATAANQSPGSRLIDHGIIRSVIPVVGDVYLFTFGTCSGDMSGMTPTGAAVANLTFACPPVVIGPQQWLAFHIWLPAQTVASSWEFMFGFSKF